MLKLYYLNSHRDLGTINTALAGHLLNNSQTFLFCFLFPEARDHNDPQHPTFLNSLMGYDSTEELSENIDSETT